MAAPRHKMQIMSEMDFGLAHFAGNELIGLLGWHTLQIMS